MISHYSRETALKGQPMKAAHQINKADRFYNEFELSAKISLKKAGTLNCIHLNAVNVPALV